MSSAFRIRDWSYAAPSADDAYFMEGPNCCIVVGSWRLDDGNLHGSVTFDAKGAGVANVNGEAAARADELGL
jgi:hypothetical protein